MVDAPPIGVQLHSFRIAQPVIRSSSRPEITAVVLLTIVAMSLWLLVIPGEFALRVAY